MSFCLWIILHVLVSKFVPFLIKIDICTCIRLLNKIPDRKLDQIWMQQKCSNACGPRVSKSPCKSPWVRTSGSSTGSRPSWTSSCLGPMSCSSSGIFFPKLAGTSLPHFPSLPDRCCSGSLARRGRQYSSWFRHGRQSVSLLRPGHHYARLHIRHCSAFQLHWGCHSASLLHWGWGYVRVTLKSSLDAPVSGFGYWAQVFKLHILSVTHTFILHSA